MLKPRTVLCFVFFMFTAKTSDVEDITLKPKKTIFPLLSIRYSINVAQFVYGINSIDLPTNGTSCPLRKKTETSISYAILFSARECRKHTLFRRFGKMFNKFF